MNATKHFLKSRTLWFNAFTLVASLSGYLPPKWAAIILPLANIALRAVTTQGLTFLED